MLVSILSLQHMGTRSQCLVVSSNFFINCCDGVRGSMLGNTGSWILLLGSKGTREQGKLETWKSWQLAIRVKKQTSLAQTSHWRRHSNGWEKLLYDRVRYQEWGSESAQQNFGVGNLIPRIRICEPVLQYDVVLQSREGQREGQRQGQGSRRCWSCCSCRRPCELPAHEHDGRGRCQRCAQVSAVRSHDRLIVAVVRFLYMYV